MRTITCMYSLTAPSRVAVAHVLICCNCRPISVDPLIWHTRVVLVNNFKLLDYSVCAMAEAVEQPQEQQRGSNRIQVSSNKKPMFFYVNLSKRLLGEHGEIHLSALGMAVSAMVSIAEILKKDGLAVETRLSTCMDTLGGDGGRRPVQKAKMEIVLKKSDKFDELIAAEKDKELAEAEANGAEAAAEEEDEEEEH